MEKLIKGYVIHCAGRYILEDPVLSKRVPAAVIQQIKHSETAFKQSDWRPRQEVMNLWKAIADVYGPDDEKEVYDAIFRCGQKTGEYSATTWLRLLLKMLTPKIFARKFPEMFARDHTFGRVELQSVAENGMVLRILDVAGYDHFAASGAGVSAYMLTAVGLKNVKVEIRPWSLANPGADDLEMVASWG